MNIVTPYPTNIPINTVNVTTESARRDNQLRDMITKPTATEAGVAERGVASEHDKSKTPQPPASFEVNLREADQHQKIGERGHGEHKDQQQDGKGEQNSNGKSEQEQNKQQQLADAKRRLAKVEGELDQVDLKEIQSLKRRDAEVRAHEKAHAAIGGQYAGSPTYSFKRGPDGNNYAVGGEVEISTSPIAGDPQATVAKMQQVRSAALAPASPSAQDRKVAASASQAITKALAEQAKQRAQEQDEKAAEQAAKAEEQQASQGTAATNESEEVNGIQSEQGFQAIDPFAAEFEPQANEQASQAQAQSVSGVFGGDVASDSQQQINLNRAEAEQRNNQRASEVVARASRIQNFYAASTKPRESGFSQFA